MEMQPELCLVDDALGILVGKWKPIILLILLQEGTHRFSELNRRVPGITQKVLTNQLHELEADDIITRNRLLSHCIWDEEEHLNHDSLVRWAIEIIDKQLEGIKDLNSREASTKRRSVFNGNFQPQI